MNFYKKHKDRFPSFQEQLNIALRYHCKEGNEKWIALCLWAGADPYAPGRSYPEEDTDEDGGISALEFAALYSHFEIFYMKRVRLDPANPILISAIRFARGEKASTLILDLMNRGVQPNDQSNGGCSAIQHLLSGLEFTYDIYQRGRPRDLDSTEAREKLKMIHILAQHGGRWMPNDKYDIPSARRSLLRMKSDYAVEFAWIMAKYHACRREDLESLFQTPTIRKHIGPDIYQVKKLLSEVEKVNNDDLTHTLSDPISNPV